MHRRVGFLVVAALAAGVSTVVPERQAPLGLDRSAELAGAVEVTFEPNVGQASGDVRFTARGPGFGLFLGATTAVLHLDGRSPATVSMRPVDGNANTAPSLEPGDPLQGRLNYLRGSDPSEWRTGIPTYGAVTYRDVYPGIDLAYHGRRGALEYDVVVGPGADASTVKLAIGGADRLLLDRDGNLAIGLPGGGTLVQQAPVAYQEDDNGGRRPVEARFVLNNDEDQVGFRVGRYDRSRPLVIDPVLTFLTYLGGRTSGLDVGNAIVADEVGNVYVNGRTDAVDFPTLGPVHGDAGGYDSYVTKFNRHGSLVFSTYLGGSGYDEGYGVGVDGTGAVYVSGWTDSTDFPVRNAMQPARVGSAPDVYDAFVAKLTPSGSDLVWSTYLGGSGVDEGYALAVDGAGNAYVAIETESTDMVTKAPVQPQNGGSEDGFIVKLTPAGQVAWATYLGGGDEDEPYGIAVTSAGAVYVAGKTKSADFPRTNPLQASLRADIDGFVTKYAPVGATVQYEWSTYHGGTSNDLIYDVDVDGAGAAYVTGVSGATDFPLQNPIKSIPQGGDLFVSKFRPDGTGLVYSTFLGGTQGDTGIGIGVDGAGAAYVGGVTRSDDFPPVNPIIPFGTGTEEPYVVKLNPAGSAVVYASSLGGSSWGFAHAVDADLAGNAYLTGRTSSQDMPTVSAVQPTLLGFGASWVAKVAAAVPDVQVVGFTWFSDGAISKAVATGGLVRAYASGTKANTSYELVVGRSGEAAPCVVDSVAINRSVRQSSNSGVIGNTAGAVNRPPGTYQVCFRQVDGPSITAPVLLTVT